MIMLFYIIAASIFALCPSRAHYGVPCDDGHHMHDGDPGYGPFEPIESIHSRAVLNHKRTESKTARDRAAYRQYRLRPELYTMRGDDSIYYFYKHRYEIMRNDRLYYESNEVRLTHNIVLRVCEHMRWLRMKRGYVRARRWGKSI